MVSLGRVQPSPASLMLKPCRLFYATNVSTKKRFAELSKACLSKVRDRIKEKLFPKDFRDLKSSLKLDLKFKFSSLCKRDFG